MGRARLGPATATAVGRPATAPAFATGRERGGSATGAGAASDPGSGTAAARGNRIRRLRPGAASVESAGRERSGQATAADRAADRRCAAEPATAAICGDAGRPRSGSIRTGQSWAELLPSAIWLTAIT